MIHCRKKNEDEDWLLAFHCLIMVQAKRINNRGESQPLVHSMNATMSKRGRYTRLMMFLWHFQFEQPFFSCAFTHPMPSTRQSAGSHYSCRRELLLQAAPTRLSENMEGVLYVNDKVSSFGASWQIVADRGISPCICQQHIY